MYFIFLKKRYDIYIYIYREREREREREMAVWNMQRDVFYLYFLRSYFTEETNFLEVIITKNNLKSNKISKLTNQTKLKDWGSFDLTGSTKSGQPSESYIFNRSTMPTFCKNFPVSTKLNTSCHHAKQKNRLI